MEIITVILILIILALPIISLLIPSRRVRKLAKFIDKLPGPQKYPLIGTAQLGLKREQLFDFFLKQSSEYGPIYRIWVGNSGIVNLNKAEHLEKILSSSTSLSKTSVYDNIRPFLKDGLITSNGGPLWHRNRKMITPSFHFTILENFIEVFNDRMVEFIDIISTQTNKQYDMYPLLANYAFDVICETAMGVQINAMGQTSNEYVNAVNQLGELAVLRFYKPWYKSDLVYYRTDQGKQFLNCLNIVNSYSAKILADRKKSATPSSKLSEEDILMGKKRRLAFLDLLLEASKETGITDYEIQQEIDTFMIAGYETISTTACWCLFMLGNHPEIQQRVRDEVNAIFPYDNKLTMKELNEMKYLDRVVKETLRLYPSAPTLGRLLSEDIVIDKYTIPAGASVAVQIYNVHRDPDHFQEPNKFNPDRFLPENCRSRHPYAYVPFSAGPRNCIGQKFALCEVKTMIAWIIKNYRIRALENEENVKMYKELVLRPQNGLQVVLERV